MRSLGLLLVLLLASGCAGFFGSSQVAQAQRADALAFCESLETPSARDACRTNVYQQQREQQDPWLAYMRGRCAGGDATACAAITGQPITPKPSGFTCRRGIGDEVVCTPN